MKLFTHRAFTLTWIVALSLTFLISCSSSKESIESTDMEETFNKAMEFFEKENYLRAEETFTYILYNDPAGAWADDAQFYLAETYFAKEEYLLAISEYDRLIRRMKNSPFVEQAFWKKTESYCELSPDYRLERDMTDKAIRYLYDFIDVYPESEYREQAEQRIVEMKEKLAMKLLDSARLYDTMREYESAVYYYDSVINEYPETKTYSSALLGKAGDMAALENWQEARALLVLLAEHGRDNLSPKEQIRLKTLGEQVLANSNAAEN